MIRILVADDHTIVREGLKQILLNTEDLKVAREASNGNEVLQFIREENYDVIMLDMSMPGRSGIELIKQIKEEKPALRILVLTMHGEEQYAIRAFKAGAQGYLTKESAPGELVSAVRKVATGGMYVSNNLAEKLAFNLSVETDKLPHEKLSDREYDVFRRIANGQTISEIAEALSVSIKTISTHKTRILQKMEMQTQADLIKYALSHHLLDKQ